MEFAWNKSSILTASVVVHLYSGLYEIIFDVVFLVTVRV